jgi:hypothetical protein
MTREDFEEAFAVMPSTEVQRLNWLGLRMLGEKPNRRRPHDIEPPLLDVLEAVILGERRIPRGSNLAACLYVSMKSHVSNERQTRRSRKTAEATQAGSDRRRRDAKGRHTQARGVPYESEWHAENPCPVDLAGRGDGWARFR